MSTPFYAISETPAVVVQLHGNLVLYITDTAQLRHDIDELRALADDLDAIHARWQAEDAKAGVA